MHHVAAIRWTLVAPLLFALIPSVAQAQDPEWDDTELNELSLAARALTTEGRVEEAIEAWEIFVASVDQVRSMGLPYGLPVELDRFHANMNIAIMLDAATGRLEVELAELSPEQAGRIVVNHQTRTEAYLRAYLEQFLWDPVDIPLSVTENVNDELGAVYMLGALLVNRGRWFDVLGDRDAAERDWTDARDLLLDAVERILGTTFGAGSAALVPPEFRYLTMLVERYLQAVNLVDGPGAYVNQTRIAMGWLPRDDHFVITQMRRQAAEWARLGIHPKKASALCGLVRDAHHDWFQGEFANLMDNVWAHVVDIAIAIDQGDLAKAEELLAALEAIPDLGPYELSMARDLRERLDSELGVAQLLEEVFRFVDLHGAGEPSRPPLVTGAEGAGVGSPPPPRARPPSSPAGERTRGPTAQPRATAPRPTPSNTRWWILAAIAVGALLATYAIAKRRD